MWKVPAVLLSARVLDAISSTFVRLRDGKLAVDVEEEWPRRRLDGLGGRCT